MKKIYAIYATVQLIKQPAWLSGFRDKYDKDHPMHITLKQTAYIEETDLPKIKKILETILESRKGRQPQITVDFDTYIFDPRDDDDNSGWIYIFAGQRNRSLDDMQLQIRENLAAYSDYFLSNSYGYEA